MTTHWRRLWQSRSPRERQVLAVAVAIIGGLLYLALLLSAQRARQRLLPAVVELRGQAALVDSSANEIARLRAMPVTPPTATDLRLLVQSQIDAADLASSLAGIESLGAGQVKVNFSALPFQDWLALVERLQAQQVRIGDTRIEALPTPGMVVVTSILIRSTP